MSTSVEDELSSFLSSSQFSVASYINLALKDDAIVANAGYSNPTPGSSDEALQRRMAELALQLQLQTQSCHEEIGRIGAELQAILPRCAADVSRVGVGLEGMRIDAKSLLDATSSNAGEELSSSLETLSTLHALQSNLGRTQEVLTAAATWDSTMASISPLLADQKLTEAVNALALLENGQRALRGMPNLEARQQQISRIRQQVQVLLQPQLKHALQSMNTRLAPLQQCVTLFRKLDKMDSLQQEYVKSRPGSIHKAWFEFTPSYSSSSAGTESDAPQSGGFSSSSESFTTWLPTWYDAVLNLLNEEKRQSTSVFGAEMAAGMIAKVFQECFRPILPSFRSRLETLYSSSVSSLPKGSFESVCAIYESTIRFLVMVYEIIAGTFLDAMESGATKKGDNGAALYAQMIETFVKVSSPFANYISGFAQLESKHSEAEAKPMFRTMQQAVAPASKSTLATVDGLQSAIDRLKESSPSIFPQLEGSLERFALMDGGFRSADSLATIDGNVSRYVDEISMSVRTLSSTITADASQLADEFDEQHILCAMEVLKLAGSIVRSFHSFKVQSKEKLAILADRMASHVDFSKAIEEATAGKNKNFTLPDSTTLAEIDSILIEAICGNEDLNAESALSTLQQIVGPDDTFKLFPTSMQSISRLTNSCQTFVFDVCSAVPAKHIRGVSAMPCWREEQATSSMDSYGTLPQQYITHIGEHMLALVQALEPLASDQESLALVNEVMENLRDVSLRAWEEFVGASGILTDNGIAKMFMDGTTIADLVLNNAALEDEELDEEITEEEKKSTEFCNAWLDVVGLAVAGRLLEQTMRFSKLSKKGCEHLAVDLNYLVNVFSALGVTGHPHPILSHMATLAAMNDEELVAHINSRDHNDRLQGALQSIETRVALLRGIAVN